MSHFYEAVARMDSGKTFEFSYANGVIFDIDPLSGAAVEIQRSQGYNQIGETVEGRSMAGISRTIRGVCLSKEAALAIVRAFPMFSSGRLTVNGYYCDFVTQKLPYIHTTKTGKRQFTMQIYCATPYWQAEEQTAVTMGSVVPAFQFPTTLDAHTFGIRSGESAEVINDGSIMVPIDIVFSAERDVERPGLVNVATGETITYEGNLSAGDQIHIFRKDGELSVQYIMGETIVDDLGRLAEDSNLFWVHPGSNPLRSTYDSGSGLNAVVSFNRAEMGVVV